MASPSCVAAINTAAGRDLSQSEVDEIENTVLRARQERATRTLSESDPTAYAAAAQELADNERLAAIIEKRSRALNVQTKLKRFAVYDAQVGHELSAIRELMVGGNGVRKGIAASVDAAQLGLKDELLGPLVHDLRQANVLDVFGRKVGPLDRDIARELWKLNDPNAPGTTNETAQTIAKILNKYQEVARLMQNDAGAWIGKETGYITRQSHDSFKMAKAGFSKWRDTILPSLDERTFAGIEDRDDYLKGVYANLVSGDHLKAGGSSWLGGFKGPANVAKKASQERSLHFKSADDWYSYNEKFGTNSMVESVVRSMEHAARNTALMRTFGTNPRAAFESDVEQLIQRVKKRDPGDTQIRKLKNWWTGALMDQIDGSASVADSPILAQRVAAFRAIQSMAKLGQVVLSSFPDLATNASALRANGVGLLESWGTAIRGSFGGVSGDKRLVADLLASGIDGHLGSILNRFHSGDSFGGTTSKLMDNYFRLNLLNWWTDSHKTGVGLMLSKNLARSADTEFGELHPQLRQQLGRYGIDAPKWDLIRQSTVHFADDDRYLTPDAVRYLDDGAVRSYLGDPEASDHQVKQTKAGLETTLRSYFSEQVRTAMTEGGAWERAAVTQGTKRGTPLGEVVRAIMQFKQFPLTFATRVLGPLVKQKDYSGIAQLIATTTALGYASITVKDFAKGLTPRDPTKVSTWLAAFTQGGGAGIYGDFLTANYNRFGGGLLETAAGPTFGLLGDAARIYGNAKDPDLSGKQRIHAVKSGLLNFATQNTPGINLFYTKAAMDYLILHNLQESVNPGYMQRTQRNLKKTTGQRFILTP